MTLRNQPTRRWLWLVFGVPAIIAAIVITLALAINNDQTPPPIAGTNQCEPDRTGTVTLAKCLGLATGSGLPELQPDQLVAVLSRFNGVKHPVLRWDIEWRFAQKEEPTTDDLKLDWGPWDLVVQAIITYNRPRPPDEQIISQNIVGLAPGWANSQAGVDCAVSHCGPDFAHAKHFGLFGGEVVKHLRALGLPSRAIRIEGWNEENQDQHFLPEPNPRIFAAMMRSLNETVKKVDPGIPVIMGGFAHVSGDGLPPKAFMVAFYAAGGKDSFDLAATHPYDGNLVETAAVHDVMAVNGEGHKKVQASEVGFETAAELQVFIDLWFAQTWTAGLLIYAPPGEATGPWDASGQPQPGLHEVWSNTLRQQRQAA